MACVVHYEQQQQIEICYTLSWWVYRSVCDFVMVRSPVTIKLGLQNILVDDSLPGYGDHSEKISTIFPVYASDNHVDKYQTSTLIFKPYKD